MVILYLKAVLLSHKAAMKWSDQDIFLIAQVQGESWARQGLPIGSNGKARPE